MILIADAGGTTTRWARVVDGNFDGECSTQGINPVIMSFDEVLKRFETEVRPLVAEEMPESIYFYGAGCAGSVGEMVADQAQTLRSKYM